MIEGTDSTVLLAFTLFCAYARSAQDFDQNSRLGVFFFIIILKTESTHLNVYFIPVPANIYQRQRNIDAHCTCGLCVYVQDKCVPCYCTSNTHQHAYTDYYTWTQWVIHYEFPFSFSFIAMSLCGHSKRRIVPVGRATRVYYKMHPAANCFANLLRPTYTIQHKQLQTIKQFTN